MKVSKLYFFLSKLSKTLFFSSYQKGIKTLFFPKHFNSTSRRYQSSIFSKTVQLYITKVSKLYFFLYIPFPLCHPYPLGGLEFLLVLLGLAVNQRKTISDDCISMGRGLVWYMYGIGFTLVTQQWTVHVLISPFLKTGLSNKCGLFLEFFKDVMITLKI